MSLLPVPQNHSPHPLWSRHLKLPFSLVKMVWSCSLQSVPEPGAISHTIVIEYLNVISGAFHLGFEGILQLHTSWLVHPFILSSVLVSRIAWRVMTGKPQLPQHTTQMLSSKTVSLLCMFMSCKLGWLKKRIFRKVNLPRWIGIPFWTHLKKKNFFFHFFQILVPPRGPPNLTDRLEISQIITWPIFSPSVRF